MALSKEQQERLAKQAAKNKRLGLIFLSVVLMFFFGIMIKRSLLG